MQLVSNHDIFRKTKVYPAAQFVIEQPAGRLILLSLYANCSFQPPFLLIFKFELLTIVKHHLVYRGPFECRENIILVGMDKLVRGRCDVVC